MNGRVTRLEPRETMRQREGRRLLLEDADAVYRQIKGNAGIESIAEIADRTGLTSQRVRRVIDALQKREVTPPRVEYGDGPRGRGWYTMEYRKHHTVAKQADTKDAKHEVGVRRRRFTRILQMEGFSNAEQIVAELELQVGVSIEVMNADDLGAFEELVYERIEAT